MATAAKNTVLALLFQDKDIWMTPQEQIFMRCFVFTLESVAAVGDHWVEFFPSMKQVWR